MPLNRKRRLPLVREADATGRTSEIYEEIKATLGVPHVNLVFQAYGAYPVFLDLMWTGLKPALESREFFRQADRLRAEAYTRTHNYFSIPELGSSLTEIPSSGGKAINLSYTVELFHYNNPPLLLITALLLQAFEDGPTSKKTSQARAEHPVFPERPAHVTEDSAPAPIRKIYDDIKRTLGLSVVNTDYQVFAKWPDFFAQYWNALKPTVSSPMYGESKHSLRESAIGLAAEVPNAPQLTVEQMQEAGLDDEEISNAIRITEDFLELLSGLVLNVAFAKIGVEGGTQPKGFRQEQEKRTDGGQPEQAA